ncbi:MAG: SAVED domain-containing protein [Caldimicrobium sp.]|jgi:hypothetical protein
MFDFSKIDPLHLLEFLHQGLLDEDIEEVLRHFSKLPQSVQFSLIKYLRENLRDSISPQALTRGLRISIEDAERILRGPSVIAKIVLFEKELKAGKISRALIIPETSKIITNLPRLRTSLKEIAEFVGKPFAIFFEDAFSGKSFMLPVAVALQISKIPESLVFTGKLNKRGQIFEVSDIIFKREIVEKEGYRLVAPPRVNNFSVIKTFLEKSTWSIPFYVTSSGKEEFDKFLEDFKGERIIEGMPLFEGLEIFYGLSKDDFCIVTGQLAENSKWQEVVATFYKKINKIKNELPGNKIFHFAMRGPAALAFSLGVVFGHFDPFVFYHFQTIEGILRYHPIEVLTPRYLKERMREFKVLRPKFEEGGKNLAVILNFSHHEATSDVKKFMQERVGEASFLVLETEYKGNLPISLFLEVAKESASYLQNLREKYSFESYYFFFSCPIPIAFMVGLAFGHYADGWIYNYEKEEAIYRPVLNFKVLRKIKEEGNLPAF